jgi:hypothetical protein
VRFITGVFEWTEIGMKRISPLWWNVQLADIVNYKSLLKNADYKSSLAWEAGIRLQQQGFL